MEEFVSNELPNNIFKLYNSYHIKNTLNIHEFGKILKVPAQSWIYQSCFTLDQKIFLIRLKDFYLYFCMAPYNVIK